MSAWFSNVGEDRVFFLLAGMLSPGVRYMLLATFFFAIMNASVKLLGHIPAVEIAFLRSVVSLALAYCIIRYHGISLPGNNRNALILRGLFGSSSLILYFITLQHMPLASAVTIQYLSPIFTAIMGTFMVKENVKPVQWLFFAISFLGVVMIQGFDGRVEVPFLLAGIGSAFFAGLAYNTIRQLKETEHPLVITFYFPLVSLPVTMVLLPGVELVMPAGYDWFILAFIGVTAQTAQYFMTRAYQSDELSKVASMKYLGVIYALLFGYFLFGEKYSVEAYVGMLIVVLGVVVNIWYKHRLALRTES
ncbi:MAG TPA: DMT family transporter [Cyclobacteriaceae bacterium]|nr:DMT family transporter [Cyclobacteriaceae bacterium]